ncbi:MAG: hypothetical protein COA78_03155 [Blastopirellula sp.]|nr:MAG: hypothetical protein COA78_03155 [Blastopirellula sp.]
MLTQSMSQSYQGDSLSISDEITKIPLLILSVVWVLILFTFSVPESIGGDLIVKLKVYTRVTSLALLAYLYWRQCHISKSSEVIYCLLPFGLFALWGMTSVIWSPLQSVSLGQIVSFSVLILLAANIALYWRSQDCTSRVIFHLSLVLLLFSSALTFAGYILPGIGIGTRSEDTMVHATMAGATAALGIILLLGARVIWGWQWSRMLVVPGLVIHGLQLYLAHNRTAIVATLFVCCLLYVIFVKREAIWACLFGGCCCASLYLLFDSSLRYVGSIFSFGSKFAERDDYDSISNLSGRTEMWDVMWKSFLESPWIGHGYFVSSASGSLEVWYEYGNWTAHNLMLQVLVSTGAIGAVLLVWALCRILKTFISTLSIDSQHNAVIYFLFILGTWFFLWSLMNESFMGPLQPESVVFFTMLGLGIGSASSLLTSNRKLEFIEPPTSIQEG